LKTEERIGPKAYLKPGAAFAGGTLARDVNFLMQMSEAYRQPSFLFPAVRESNGYHKGWVQRKCLETLLTLAGKNIALLGLTYKPGTNTLRRSLAVELALWLHHEKAVIHAFDPHVTELPQELEQVLTLHESLPDILQAADCIVVATEHPVFREIDKSLVDSLSNKIVIDATGYLDSLFRDNRNISYFVVGRPQHETPGKL
jgi:UDPglucose 6-dehydrogenase